MRELPRLAARLAAGLVVAAVMAGPVIAVAAAAGNPIPADLLDRLAARNLDDATIVKVLSVGFYICWAWFCAPALRQVWAALGSPRRGRVRPAASPRTGPAPSRAVEPAAGGPRGWLAGLARFAVSGVIAASSVAPASPPASATASTPISTQVATAVVAEARTQTSASTDDVTSVAASHRDTPYALARRFFPPERVDAVREAIVELNAGRPLPDGTPYRGGGFPVGWTVVIPAVPAGSESAAPGISPAGTVDATSGVSDTAAAAAAPDADGSGTVVAVEAPGHSAVTVTVRDGDNLWDLSVARHEQLGVEPEPAVIGAYVAEVAAVNADQVEDPNLIYTGQQLVLPPIVTAAAIPAPTPAPADSTAPAPVAPDGTEPVIHVIQLGDTLWDVLEAYHGAVDADMIWQVADLNGIDDPSNIPVGTPVIIAWRPVATPPTPQPEATTPTPMAETPPPAPTVPDTPPVADGADVTSPPTPSRTPVTLPTVAEPAVPPVPPTDRPLSSATSLPAAPVPADGEVDDGGGLFEWSPRSVWAAIPVGVLLAAGLTGMTRRLRARRLSRLMPGEQLVAPPPIAAGVELAVSAGDPDGRLSTLQGLLRTVTPYAREQADPPAVRAVEFDDDRVEVLFAAPAPFPPQGWTSIDGGASWVHRFVDVAPTAVRQLVTPALVTLGLRAGGGEVLLDLETAGSLALAGDRVVARGMARAMALELATYPLGVAMDVCLIGFDVDGTELCDRTWKGTTLTRAVRVARDVLDRTAATGAASLVAARAATDDDEALLDPQVFLVDADGIDDDDRRLLDELVGLCTPQSGAAVVIIGDHPAARERVEVVSVDTARWVHSVLRPTALDREAVAQVAVMFDHAANATAEPLAPSMVVADLLDSDGDGEASATVAAPHVNGDRAGPVPDLADDDELVEPYRYDVPPFDVLVKVLGHVAVEGRPITAGVDVEMLALLAFKRDQPPNVDTLRFLLEKRRRRPDNGTLDDARWAAAAAESAVKTLRNRASALRRNLGVGADGEDLLPRAAQPGCKGRYQLSSRVLTDVDLIEHRFHTATELASGDALPLLRDGLARFVGPAFRGGGDGYGWIGPEGVLTRITNVVIAYATLLMELAFDADDLALVLQAAAAAGRVIDDPVALMPMSEVQRQFAEASGDPDLTAAVVEAHRRLRAHADAYDPLAGG